MLFTAVKSSGILAAAEEGGKEGITERDLRNIIREPRWDRQRVLFKSLVRRHG